MKWYGTMTDIEDQKRAEEALHKANAALAHVTRVMTMGEFAASIAHEVSQPLSAVLSNADACLNWLAGTPPYWAPSSGSRSRVARDGKRAGEVIERTRALCKNTGTEKQRLDVNEAIEEVLALARGEMRIKRVALRTELATRLPPVLGDRVQLQQVVLNLIMNGIEAMSLVEDRPRELVIRTRDRQGRWVGVIVQTRAPGIDPRTVEQIFDSFYSTKRRGWAWDSRSAARLCKITAGGCGQQRMRVRARRFSSRLQKCCASFVRQWEGTISARRDGSDISALFGM